MSDPQPTMRDALDAIMSLTDRQSAMALCYLSGVADPADTIRACEWAKRIP